MANAITTIIIVTIAIILSVKAQSTSTIDCPNPNEIYTPCESPCPKTCANKDQGRNICPAVCKSLGACVCKQGFVLGWNRDCIKPEDCPTCRGPNEIYSCGPGCDRTCETLGEVCPILNTKCNEKCYCKEGFARDSKGTCVPINECPTRQCKNDPNAVTKPCGDPCPLSCDNKDEVGPRPCIEICIVNGCTCKNGFVRDSNGICILPENCPVNDEECGENEIFDKCPPVCPPESTCRSYVSGVQYKCAPTTKCVPKCRCKKGYIRDNKNGKCIHPDSCCNNPNSEMVRCPNPCPGGTCENPNFSPCKMGCRFRGCQCKKGFVKKSNTDPTCVLNENCESSIQE